MPRWQHRYADVIQPVLFRGGRWIGRINRDVNLLLSCGLHRLTDGNKPELREINRCIHSRH